MSYSLNKTVHLSFDETIQKLTEELKKEGFGILTQIDVKETLKKKINEDFRPYMILGACNPQFAFKVLSMDDKIGVFLPCNIVVQQHEDGQVEISIGDPEEMMKSASSTDSLQTFAQVVKNAMQRVLANISSPTMSDSIQT
jgi:uncharacterized protein (DUF302 family)